MKCPACRSSPSPRAVPCTARRNSPCTPRRCTRCQTSCPHAGRVQTRKGRRRQSCRHPPKYLISFFLLSVFQMSQKPLWQVTIRDDRLNSHVPDFLFTRFHNGSCHPFFLCGCRFFPRGIMVCYRMGKAISITTMNYSVAIFVYSRMIRYPDNAITELRYSRISK